MFTGIVTEVGKVSAVQREEDRLAFTIEAPYEDLFPDLFDGSLDVQVASVQGEEP